MLNIDELPESEMRAYRDKAREQAAAELKALREKTGEE